MLPSFLPVAAGPSIVLFGSVSHIDEDALVMGDPTGRVAVLVFGCQGPQRFDNSTLALCLGGFLRDAL